MQKLTETVTNERVATDLTTSDFYYDLPEELIAQSPSEERDGCRLMVLDRERRELEATVISSAEAGVDAFIVSDLGAAARGKRVKLTEVFFSSDLHGKSPLLILKNLGAIVA